MRVQLSLTLLLLALAVVDVRGWKTGRATFYADTNDPWQLGMGACQYGYIDPNKCTGRDVAAISDTHALFKHDGSKSCGLCMEVRCKNINFRDGYGKELERDYVCYGSGSVVVQMIDTCECKYAPNAYSNKRWCCGDMDHVDLSVWAFEKLASKIWGVIAIEYRQVDCSYKPDNPATLPAGKSETYQSEKPPAGWKGGDGRPCSGTNRRSAPRKNPPRRNTPSRSGGVRLSSWNINRWSSSGVIGGTATACGTVLPWGGFTLSGNFKGRRAVDFWVKRSGNKIPDLKVRPSGKGCVTRPLHKTARAQSKGGWDRFVVNFKGACKKSISRISISNGWRWQNICIDRPRVR